jgi:hypothetical protein
MESRVKSARLIPIVYLGKPMAGIRPHVRGSDPTQRCRVRAAPGPALHQALGEACPKSCNRRAERDRLGFDIEGPPQLAASFKGTGDHDVGTLHLSARSGRQV